MLTRIDTSRIVSEVPHLYLSSFDEGVITEAWTQFHALYIAILNLHNA
jgi:hypothetical protein